MHGSHEEFREPPAGLRAGVGTVAGGPLAVLRLCGVPFYVANEGKLVAFVPRQHAEAVLDAMRAHPLGRGATVIGEAVEAHPGMVMARTRLGGTRVVDLPLGEQLPRIC